jgi:hypothetical protein
MHEMLRTPNITDPNPAPIKIKAFEISLYLGKYLCGCLKTVRKIIPEHTP